METWLLLTTYIGSRRRSIRWYHRWPPTTYRLATIPHDWHTIVHYDAFEVIHGHRFPYHSKANMWPPLVISGNVGLISHRLATIHPWQTTTTMPIARPLLKYGLLQRECKKSTYGGRRWRKAKRLLPGKPMCYLLFAYARLLRFNKLARHSLILFNLNISVNKV